MAEQECDEHCLNFCRLLSEPQRREVIARGMGIDERALLNDHFGAGRWRKLKGHARIELDSGDVRRAEIHGYKAHGIGRRKIKRVRFLD